MFNLHISLFIRTTKIDLRLNILVFQQMPSLKIFCFSYTFYKQLRSGFSPHRVAYILKAFGAKSCLTDTQQFDQVICNYGHNILRLFDILANFPLTCGETKRSVIISNKHGIQGFPHELPNDLKHRILGNQEIARKSENLIELQPTAQPSSVNKNLVNTSKKLLKNRN